MKNVYMGCETYRVSVISPRTEFHKACLLIEWKVFNIDFAK